MKDPTLFIIGPTAVGKSTLLGRALEEFPQLHDVITYTTRAPRAGEKEGDPYHFVTEDRFRQLIKEEFFIEWANVHGRLYGTPRAQMREAHARGKIVIMDVDVQGAKTLLGEFPHAVTVFISPPNEDALRQRFKKRGVTSEDDLQRRLESAQKEMAQAQDFDLVIVNDDFDRAYAELRKVIEKLIQNQ
ncbi:MAG: guanylate kinase [Bdellovibrionales bacterium]